MDRRQRKTREAIFNAFIELLAEKNVNRITVAEIIEKADVGRATFYAHFDTKDFLQKEMAEELICHVFDSVNNTTDHRHIFDDKKHEFADNKYNHTPYSLFLHLFQHLKANDKQIMQLISGQNNELFLRYFKAKLMEFVIKHQSVFVNESTKALPKDFWMNHIAITFIETIRWWGDNKQMYTAEQITEYVISVLQMDKENNR